MENDKTCVAMICHSRWYLPNARKVVSVSDNVHVVDWPTDAEFIKNTAYGQCRMPGEAWDEHANCRAEDESGWLCAYHARGDKAVLQTVTVAELWDVGKYFAELNAEQAQEQASRSCGDGRKLRPTFDEDELDGLERRPTGPATLEQGKPDGSSTPEE